MTLSEARVARDQLRAEYAVKTRRLELGAEGLKERMIRQELDVSECPRGAEGRRSGAR